MQREGFFGEADPSLLMLLRQLALCEFGLFVERVDHLAEQLLLSHTPATIRLQVQLGIAQEGVEFLVVGLEGGLERLGEVAQDVELAQLVK